MDALNHLFDQLGATWFLWLAALRLDPDVATVLAHLVEGLLLWVLSNFVVAEAWTVWQIVKVVILSSSPLLFGFLTAIPLLGPAINRLLSVWSLVVLWAVVGLTFQPGPWAAVALVLVAWLGMLLLGNLLGPVLAEVRDRLWRRVTGQPLHLDTNFLLELADGPDEGPP